MEYIIFLGAIVFFFIVWLINGMLQEKKRKLRFREKLNHLEGTLPDKKYDPNHFLFAGQHINGKQDEFVIDDITWNDLSMDDVFKRMDYTYCAAGEEMLYRLLHKPSFDQKELAHRREIIRYFSEHKEDRVSLQLLFAAIGRTGKYSIYEYLEYLEALQVRNNTKDIAVLCAMAVSLGILFVNPGIGAALLFVLILYNFTSYLKIKGEIGPYITTFSYIGSMLNHVESIVKTDIPVLSDELSKLKKNADLFKGFRAGVSLVAKTQGMDGDPTAILFDYICMIFHIDLMKFNKMHKQVTTHHDELKEMFETIGYIEAMISIALYRKSLAVYCEPALSKEEPVALMADAVYHPLITSPVANSITCKNGVLLTGSNASGKSTFLKTIAINAILAQTIDTCTANRYEGAFFRVYSSMSLRDDLMGGDSYFIVEIKAIKRIVDACQKEDAPVLCFVDEVLRGTNTVERIAASTEILKALQESNAICFAATHDLELTKLLAQSFDNYHFEEKLEGNDVTFAYQLLEGEATSRNAIELLRVLGFDSEIIKKAHENARQYLERENIWMGVSEV